MSRPEHPETRRYLGGARRARGDARPGRAGFRGVVRGGRRAREPDLQVGGMSTICIPPELRVAVDEHADPARREWLTRLPELIGEIASCWALELDEPYLPGG